MNKKDKSIILEFKRRIPQEINKRLKRFIVFGSRAKGNALEDSDLDVIVLVDTKTPEIENKLEEIAYQVMWYHDFNPIISLKTFSELNFNTAVNKGYSFYTNVIKEGVSL